MKFVLKGLLEGIIEKLVAGGTVPEGPKVVVRGGLTPEQLQDPAANHVLAAEIAAALSNFAIAAAHWPLHAILQASESGEVFKLVVGFGLEQVLDFTDGTRPFTHVSRGRGS